LAVELRAALLRQLAPADVERGEQQVVGVEAGIEVDGVAQGAQEEARADEQHERERDLRDDERVAQAEAAQPGRRAAGVVLERRDEIGARGVERGGEAEDEARRERDGEREEQHARVDREIEQRRLFRGEEAGQQVGRPQRDDEPDAAAREREHDRFRDQLPHEPPARRSEREPDRDLTPPGGGPRQQEVRHVRAGDEQHDADDREQEEGDGA
jgi:hypothetical protein